MFLMPLLRSSLTPIGYMRYPDFLGVQNTLNFSLNIEKSALRIPCPLSINFLALFVIPDAVSEVIFVINWFN